VTAACERPPRQAPLSLAGCRDEVLHEDDRVRIRRVWLPDGAGSVVCKEFLGPGAAARALAETTVLGRLAGLAGVAQLSPLTLPGVVVLRDFGGRPLLDVIDRKAVDLAGLPEFALSLTRIVASVHRRGVVHKDINPRNVLFTADGGLLLASFDQASTFAEDRPGFTHHRDIVGALPYLAPEQTGRTGLPVDHRADLYALGAVWYELATGHPPFGHGDAGTLQLVHDILVTVPPPLAGSAPQLPGALSDIVARLLEKEPDRRYQSADGLARDLALLVRRPGTRFRLGEWDFPPRSGRRCTWRWPAGWRCGPTPRPRPPSSTCARPTRRSGAGSRTCTGPPPAGPGAPPTTPRPSGTWPRPPRSGPAWARPPATGRCWTWRSSGTPRCTASAGWPTRRGVRVRPAGDRGGRRGRVRRAGPGRGRRPAPPARRQRDRHPDRQRRRRDRRAEPGAPGRGPGRGRRCRALPGEGRRPQRGAGAGALGWRP
jgi:serine/threonine protein kinase